MQNLGWLANKVYYGRCANGEFQRLIYRAHVLMWPAAMQIYCNKKKLLREKKSSTSTGLVWDANIESARGYVMMMLLF